MQFNTNYTIREYVPSAQGSYKMAIAPQQKNPTLAATALSVGNGNSSPLTFSTQQPAVDFSFSPAQQTTGKTAGTSTQQAAVASPPPSAQQAAGKTTGTSASPTNTLSQTPAAKRLFNPNEKIINLDIGGKNYTAALSYGEHADNYFNRANQNIAEANKLKMGAIELGKEITNDLNSGRLKKSDIEIWNKRTQHDLMVADAEELLKDADVDMKKGHEALANKADALMNLAKQSLALDQVASYVKSQHGRLTLIWQQTNNTTSAPSDEALYKMVIAGQVGLAAAVFDNDIKKQQDQLGQYKDQLKKVQLQKGEIDAFVTHRLDNYIMSEDHQDIKEARAKHDALKAQEAKLKQLIDATNTSIESLEKNVSEALKFNVSNTIGPVGIAHAEPETIKATNSQRAQTPAGQGALTTSSPTAAGKEKARVMPGETTDKENARVVPGQETDDGKSTNTVENINTANDQATPEIRQKQISDLKNWYATEGKF